MKIPALVLSLLLSSPAYAYKVIGITDGDTLKILKDGREVAIRLAGIDAPEKNQAYGQRSKESLSELCWGKDVQYDYRDMHRKRIVGIVRCGGVEVNRAQVERGMAMVYPRYNRDRSLPAIQEQAKEAKRGLWRDLNPTPPWEFRRHMPRSQ